MIFYVSPSSHDRGSTVVKVLCYKSEGRWFESQLVSLKFFIDKKSIRSHYGPGVDSASNRNEYREHILGGRGYSSPNIVRVIKSK